MKLLFIVLSVLYPFLVYWALSTQHVYVAFIVLALLMMQRIGFAKSRVERYLALGFILLMALIAITFGLDMGLQLYPVFINLLLLFVFASSLLNGMPVIEQLARLREPDLPPHAVVYTRQVTKVWCGFFAVNASISLFTVWWSDPQLWLLYNGVIAYLLIAILFSVEWLYRQRLRANLR